MSRCPWDSPPKGRSVLQRREGRKRARYTQFPVASPFFCSACLARELFAPVESHQISSGQLCVQTSFRGRPAIWGSSRLSWRGVQKEEGWSGDYPSFSACFLRWRRAWFQCNKALCTRGMTQGKDSNHMVLPVVSHAKTSANGLSDVKHVPCRQQQSPHPPPFTSAEVNCEQFESNLREGGMGVFMVGKCDCCRAQRYVDKFPVRFRWDGGQLTLYLLSWTVSVVINQSWRLRIKRKTKNDQAETSPFFK